MPERKTRYMPIILYASPISAGFASRVTSTLSRVPHLSDTLLKHLDRIYFKNCLCLKMGKFRTLVRAIVLPTFVVLLPFVKTNKISVLFSTIYVYSTFWDAQQLYEPHFPSITD